MACENGNLDPSGNCTCNVGYWQTSPGVCASLDQSAGTPNPANQDTGGGGGLFKNWQQWLPGLLTTAGAVIASTGGKPTKPDGTPVNVPVTPTPPPTTAPDNGWIKWVIIAVLGLVGLVVALRLMRGNRAAAVPVPAMA